MSEVNGKQLAKHQPCGCVICTCEDTEKCHGCGARHCGKHRVGSIPNPVYEAPSLTAELTEAKKRIGELEAMLGECVTELRCHERTDTGINCTVIQLVDEARVLLSNEKGGE